MPSVAVIDIGSNSIKILVARRAPDGSLATLQARTIDARISAGIGASAPRLSEDGMAQGLDAVRSLLADAAAFSPVQTVLVATSAVRDAQNGAEFRARIRTSTGLEVRILTGAEEAGLIGRGLTADPTLLGLRDFYVFDLGGGSLECLAFRGRRIEQGLSLQLGCVRLTEKFVADPTRPFSEASAQAIAAHTRDGLTQSSFRFSLPKSTVAVGTGGTVTTARAVLGARTGTSLEQTDRTVTVVQLRELLAWLGGLALPERKRVPGLLPPRADVFPTALATLIALAEVGGFSAFQNSLCNLRHGLADQALA